MAKTLGETIAVAGGTGLGVGFAAGGKDKVGSPESLFAVGIDSKGAGLAGDFDDAEVIFDFDVGFFEFFCEAVEDGLGLIGLGEDALASFLFCFDSPTFEK